MPERTTVAAIQAGRHTDQTVEIAGWLYNLRKSGKIVFPIVRDGTGLIQCVALKSELPESLFEELKHLTQESSLIIRGKVRAEARAQGGYEKRGHNSKGFRSRSLSDYAQGSWRRFPHGSSPSLAAFAEAARHHPGAA
jgi:aspartyl/asparaginyl-tRNA synthetase